MSEYIKLEDALDLAVQCITISNITYDKVCRTIDNLPTIEVSEDCIDRKALLEQIYTESEGRTGYGDEWEFIDTIHNAPSVVPSRADGKWVADDDDENIMFTVYKCSRCGNVLGSDPHNYCPNCGTRMEG